MTSIQLERAKERNTLIEAIKFNTQKTNGFKVICDKESQLKKFALGPTQLTLPHRFGMYKTPTKDVPKTTKIELEDP